MAGRWIPLMIVLATAWLPRPIVCQRLGTCSIPSQLRERWFIRRESTTLYLLEMQDYQYDHYRQDLGSSPVVESELHCLLGSGDTSNFDFLKAPPGQASPRDCVGISHNGQVIFRTSISDFLPQTTSECRTAGLNLPAVDVLVKYPFMIPQSCPFAIQGSFLTTVAETDYNNRLCVGTNSSITIYPMHIQINMCLNGGGYARPYQANLMCVGTMMTGDGGERVILATTEGATDDYMFYCATFSENTTTSTIEMSIDVRSSQQATCQRAATPKTVDSSNNYIQFSMLLDRCTLSDFCVNGDCTQTSDGFTCACHPGWTGTSCNTDINECSSNPCQNGAFCINRQNAYLCSCELGFTGVNCENILCNMTDEWTRYPYWTRYGGSYESEDATIAKFSTTHLKKTTGSSERNLLCENSMLDPSDGFTDLTFFDIATNGMRHCREIRKSMSTDIFLRQRESIQMPRSNPYSIAECRNELGLATEHDLWVKYPFNYTESLNMTLFPTGYFKTVVSNASMTLACEGITSDNSLVTGHGVNVKSCINEGTYTSPFSDVDFIFIGSYVDVDGVLPQGTGLVMAMRLPSAVEGETSGYSFFCGKSYVDEDSIKFSLNAESPWYSKCVVDSHYETTTNSHVAFILTPAECEEQTPCSNGGTCVNSIQDNKATYTCQCPTGFTGKECQSNADECMSDPCENDGTCTDGNNMYTCSCASGYTGTNCELEIGGCESSPCNGGTCIDVVNGYTCNCEAAYTGTHCETDRDPCLSSPCEDFQTCAILENGEHECLGPRSPKPFLCLPDYCYQGGTCFVENNSPRCKCVDGYTGRLCETDIDECATAVCENRGSCVQGINKYHCICPDDYIGDHCQYRDPCLSSPCEDIQTCAIMDHGKHECLGPRAPKPFPWKPVVITACVFVGVCLILAITYIIVRCCRCACIPYVETQDDCSSISSISSVPPCAPAPLPTKTVVKSSAKSTESRKVTVSISIPQPAPQPAPEPVQEPTQLRLVRLNAVPVRAIQAAPMQTIPLQSAPMQAIPLQASPYQVAPRTSSVFFREMGTLSNTTSATYADPVSTVARPVIIHPERVVF